MVKNQIAFQLWTFTLKRITAEEERKSEVGSQSITGVMGTMMVNHLCNNTYYCSVNSDIWSNMSEQFCYTVALKDVIGSDFYHLFQSEAKPAEFV